MVFLAVMLLTPSVGAQKSPQFQALPLCELLANAADHDGDIITVRGIYLRMPYGSILTAPGCTLSPPPDVNLRMAPEFHQKKDRIMKTIWSLTEKWKPVKVTLKGRLHVAKREQGFGQGVEPYEIEVIQYLSAARYNEQNPRAKLQQQTMRWGLLCGVVVPSSRSRA